QQNERTRGQGHNTCPRLRFQATFRREYKSAHPLLYRKDKGTDDARSHAAARKLHTIQDILGGNAQWLKSQNSKSISDMNSLPGVTPARTTSPSRQSTSTISKLYAAKIIGSS